MSALSFSSSLLGWYRKAAERGIAEAQYHLGECYANGEGVAKDEKAAVSWYRKAAAQGNKQAQKKLGDYSGKGVEKNEKTTFYGADLAADPPSKAGMPPTSVSSSSAIISSSLSIKVTPVRREVSAPSSEEKGYRYTTKDHNLPRSSTDGVKPLAAKNLAKGTHDPNTFNLLQIQDNPTPSSMLRLPTVRLVEKEREPRSDVQALKPLHDSLQEPLLPDNQPVIRTSSRKPKEEKRKRRPPYSRGVGCCCVVS